MMEGEIGLQATPGEGSTFWFTVPLEIGDSSTVSTVTDWRQFKDSLSADYVKKSRVLVAEDNVVNQEILAQILHTSGISFDTVANGAEALDAIGQFDYGIILMDIHMPVMDGHQATNIIRAMPGKVSTIPIIAVTADAMPGKEEQYLAEGFDGYIPKPYTANAIIGILSHWLAPKAVPDGVDAPIEAVAAEAGNGSGGNSPENHIGTSEDVLDHKVLDEAREIYANNEGGFESWVRMFIENASNTVDAIKGLIAQKDIEAVHDLAHSLKGSSGFIGATKLSDICRRLDAMSQEEQPNEGLGDLTDCLSEEFDRVKDALIRMIS